MTPSGLVKRVEKLESDNGDRAYCALRSDRFHNEAERQARKDDHRRQSRDRTQEPKHTAGGS